MEDKSNKTFFTNYTPDFLTLTNKENIELILKDFLKEKEIIEKPKKKFQFLKR